MLKSPGGRSNRRENSPSAKAEGLFFIDASASEKAICIIPVSSPQGIFFGAQDKPHGLSDVKFALSAFFA
jgi:hypothetical protein